jgi:O-antigen/teichoic acid export membrane protein
VKPSIPKTLKRLLPKSRFAIDVSILAGGTGIAQAIILLSSPILTRLYSPSDFGLMAVYVSLLSVLGVVASLRYELAMPLPEDDAQAAQVAALCFLVLLINTCLVALFSLIFGNSIANWLAEPGLVRFLALLPLGFFLLGLYEILNYWAIRIKAFPDIARTKLTKAIATTTVQVAGASLGPLALIVGQIVGHGAGIGRLAHRVYQSSAHRFAGLSWAAMRENAWRYRDLPLFSSPAALLNMGSTALPVLLIASLFSSGSAGLYAIAQRVLTLPMMLVGQAVSDVFLSDAVEAHRAGGLAERTLKVHAILVRLGMPILFILPLTGETAFGLVFGEQWSDAGRYAAYLSPWMYIVFTAAPIASVIIVLERQRFSAAFNLIVLIFRTFTIILGAALFSVEPTILLFAVVSAVSVFLFLVFVFSFLGIRSGRWIWLHARTLIFGVLLFWLPYEAFTQFVTSAPYLIALITTTTAAYYAFAYHSIRSEGSFGAR